MSTQFITDENGKKISAILPIRKYHSILEQLDELACIKAYDAAKAKKNSRFMPLADALKAASKKQSN